MSDAARRIDEAARDARSGSDLVGSEMDEYTWEGDMLVPRPLDSPLDEETLDERASTQMGPWDSRRRGAE